MDTQITRLAQYVDLVRGLSKLWAEPGVDWFVHPWFRGHSDESWRLEPGVFRHEKVQGVGAEYYSEAQLLCTFKQRAPRFIDRMPVNDWEWWGLMQHHGLPTRLLDWTESSLIALHFALRDNDLKRSAALWAMNLWWVNKQRFNQYVLFSTDDERAAPWKIGAATLEQPPIALLPSRQQPDSRSTRLFHRSRFGPPRPRSFGSYLSERGHSDVQVHRAGPSGFRIAP